MNIAITNYCNLHCPYCFANEFIESKKQNITEAQLDRILDFLLLSQQSRNYRIGVIGGEPTLHPQFRNILEKIIVFSKINNFITPTVFTNGILLKEYIDLFDNAKCLINVNHPDIIGASNWDKLEQNLMIFEYANNLKNVNFGINLYHNMLDFSYIFELLKDFKKNYIRCSFVAPTNNKMSKEEYYGSGKELFLNFIKEADKNHIEVNLDCNYIPFCYFDNQEVKLLKKVITPKSQNWCEPVIDFTPDFKAISCFGTSKPIDVSLFKNYKELEHYFQFYQIYPLTLKNNEGKCKTCPSFSKASCQGGCLGFVKNKEDSI